jgi:hypothetical protein
MLINLFIVASLLGDTVKSSTRNMSFIELYNNQYCLSYEPAVLDTNIHYTLIPQTPNIALYFGYSTPGCIGGVSIEDVILRDTSDNIIYTGFSFGDLQVGYPYDIEVIIRTNGACLGIDNICPYYINISSLAVELCGYKLLYNKEVVCDFIICSSTASRRFLVDRSSNLVNWTRVTEISAEAYSSSIRTYSFNDSNYLPDISYYRVIEEDLNGNLTIVFIDYIVCPQQEKRFYYDLSGRLINIR